MKPCSADLPTDHIITMLPPLLRSTMLSLSPTIWASILIPLALILLPVLWYFLKPPHIPGIPNATPMLPLIGNAIFYGYDPTLYLQQQRKKHGDVFLVNLAIFKVVFFFGPEGTNAILKGTERSGISFWYALEFLMGVPVTRGITSHSNSNTLIYMACCCLGLLIVRVGSTWMGRSVRSLNAKEFLGSYQYRSLDESNLYPYRSQTFPRMVCIRRTSLLIPRDVPTRSNALTQHVCRRGICNSVW